MKRFLIYISFSLSVLSGHGQMMMTAIGTNASQIFDASAQTFINTAAITNNTQRYALSWAAKGLKAYGLWSNYLGIYVFVGGTSSTHAVNFKSPGTYDLTFVGSPTHSATGTDWNGSTQYANTNIPNSSVLTESSCYFSVYCQENADEVGFLYGGDDGTRHFGMLPKYTSTFYSDLPTEANGRLQVNTAYDTRAMWGASQTPTRINTGYRNGVSIGSMTSTTVGAYTSGNIIINARSSVPEYSGTKIISWFAVANVGFTSTQVANEYTVVQALQTALGRNQ